MKSGSCSLSEQAFVSFDNKSVGLMYGGYCKDVEHNSINMGIQTSRPEINTCRNSISIGVDSGSTIGSSIEDSCGKNNSMATGNISIGTQSGQYQYNPSIAIGYKVGSNDNSPQQPYSISIQNDGSNTLISKSSLGFGAYNVPDLSENSIYLGTGFNDRYTIQENSIVLSTLNRENNDPDDPYPGVALKKMGKDNNGFFVDAIRVNPTKNVPTDAIPLVYSPSTGEIYAKHY